MSAILALFGGSWTTIGALLIGAGGFVWGLFKHQQTKTAVAEKNEQTVIANTAVVAAANTQKALTAVTTASADRVATDAAVPTAPGAAQSALADEGFTK